MTCFVTVHLWSTFALIYKLLHLSITHSGQMVAKHNGMTKEFPWSIMLLCLADIRPPQVIITFLFQSFSDFVNLRPK